VLGDAAAATIVAFLREIGLTVRLEPIDGETVLPGIDVRDGALVVDEARLLYPGDLLHEAGHLAVMTPERRADTSYTFKHLGDEIGAIAWSYAAAVHLKIDPRLVFHPAGYRGHSEWFLEQYSNGGSMGVPLLQWMGMTVDLAHAADLGIVPYPAMTTWTNPGPNGSE
jgi:hypothetical protein